MKNSDIIITTLFVLGLVIGAFTIMVYLVDELNPTLQERALYGDSFGFVNSLFSALAFAAIILSLFLQKKELDKQIEEIKNSNIELKQSNDFLGKQIKILAKSNDANVAIGLFNEFRSKKWHKIREKIKENSDLKFEEVVHYSHLLNHLGFLLHHKYIDIESFHDMLGRGVMDFWDKISPQIYKKRKDSDDPTEYYPYQFHFEYLNYKLRKHFPEGKKRIDTLLKEMKEYRSEKN
jgi:hypothetical protein